MPIRPAILFTLLAATAKLSAGPLTVAKPVLRPAERLHDYISAMAAGLPESHRPKVSMDDLTNSTVISLGKYSIAVEPINLYPWGGKGKAFAGIRLETRLNGRIAEPLSTKGLEFGETPEAASEKIFSHWWRIQVIPTLSKLSGTPPALTVGDVQVWTPVVAGTVAAAGSLVGTPEVHTKLLSLAEKNLTNLCPGDLYTAVISRETQPNMALVRNWDGTWIVDEKMAKKVRPAPPTCTYALSTGPDASLTKALEKFCEDNKITKEFAFGYVLIKKAPAEKK